MVNICDNCGKKPVVGRQHQHRKGVAAQRWGSRVKSTLKVFRPNLHRTKLMVNGVKKKMLLCTKCLRLLKKKYSTAPAV